RNRIMVIQLAGGAGFRDETLERRRVGGESLRQDLDRHFAFDERIKTAVDDSHAPLAEDSTDFVFSKRGADARIRGRIWTCWLGGGGHGTSDGIRLDGGICPTVGNGMNVERIGHKVSHPEDSNLTCAATAIESRLAE